MNSKDRVKTALSFEKPDRVPVSATYVPEIQRKLRDVVGNEDVDLGVLMGNDIVYTVHGFVTGAYLKDSGEYYDEWGCKRKVVKHETGNYTEVVEHPLAREENLVSYKIPDPYDDSRYNESKKIIEKYGENYCVVGAVNQTIFECAWGLRGLHTFIMDIVNNKDFVHELMDKIMEFPLVAGEKLISQGVDIIYLGDDVAMQTGMMISPASWREFLKPRYARLISEFKKVRKDIKIAYHCCGNCESILDELYDIGIEVIHPIQPKAMNPINIKKRYGKKFAMWGAMDIQEILPFKSQSEVEEEVKRLIENCGSDGGFILAPAHNIQSDTPIENILAFYNAAKKYGSL